MTANRTVWDTHTIRQLERESIRAFVERNRDRLVGDVLDYGAGKPGSCAVPQPYRDLVAGTYHPWEPGDRVPVAWQFDTILCTQVLQYVPDPRTALSWFHCWLRPGGCLVLSYATNWDEVEASDLWRFTKAGMESMLKAWKILSHERRAEIEIGGFRFPLGYGVVARRI